MVLRYVRVVAAILPAALLPIVEGGPATAADGEDAATLGPRPFYLVDDMDPGPLKATLSACKGPFTRSDFSIGHRGAAMQFPEHTRESYMAAARMGAGIIECDVAFTKDRELVCRHSQCDLATTTDILARPDLAAKCAEPFTPADPETGAEATAKCCTSDITLAEFKSLNGKMDAFNPRATTAKEYMGGTPGWRTDLYATQGTLMSHAESVELFKALGVKFTPELKAPEVEMPFEGEYTREAYAGQLVQAYEDAGIDPADVYLQSFDGGDVDYWIKNHPEFGKQAVWLDDRYDVAGFDLGDPATWEPSMEDLKAKGVNIIAPPLFMLVTLNEGGRIVPSIYAKRAKDAGLEIITWTLERSGPLASGGGWYYQTINDAVNNDGDVLTLLDVLAQEVGVMAVFSDWPATTTFYANCMNLR